MSGTLLLQVSGSDGHMVTWSHGHIRPVMVTSNLECDISMQCSDSNETHDDDVMISSVSLSSLAAALEFAAALAAANSKMPLMAPHTVFLE